MKRPLAPACQRSEISRNLLSLCVGLLCSAAVGCRSATEPTERDFNLEVSDHRVPCMAVGPRECLQVRESSEASWQLFYDDIEGFAYEPGFRYVLLIAERRVPNPPADGSSLAYRLLRVVSKTPTS